MSGPTMAPVKQLYALKAYYRVVYMNGLSEPTETLIGASDVLDVDNLKTLDEVCQFIQRSIDLDCRRVLFMYREQTDAL